MTRAGTCIDPRMQVVEGKTVCLVSCQRSPEPMYLRWKGLEKAADGELLRAERPGHGAAGAGGRPGVRRDAVHEEVSRSR